MKLIKEPDLLFDDNPVPLFVMDGNQAILEVNRAFSSRYFSSPEIIGRYLNEFSRSGPRELLPDQPYSKCRYLELPDGSSLLVELRINKISHQDNPVYLVAVKELFPTLMPDGKAGQPIIEAMVHKTFDLVLVTDNYGRYIHVNDTACRKLGYTREELLQMSVADITYRPMQSQSSTLWEEFLANGSDQGTYLLQTKTGEVLYAEYCAVANIRPGQHLSILRDVTLQKQLQKQEWFKNEVIESSPDGVVFLDRDKKITYVNASWLSMWGFDSMDEVTDRQLTEFFDQPSRLALIERKLHRQGLFRGQLRGIRSDGSRFHVMASVSMIADPYGEPFYRMASFEDISSRIEIRQDLRNSNRRYQKLLESVPDAMLLIDREGKIVFSNKASQTIFGYAKSELMGLSVELLMSEEYRLRYWNNIRAYFKNPTKHLMDGNLDLYARRKDGSTFPVDIMAGPLEDEDTTNMLAVIRDITRFKEAQKKLKQEVKFTELIQRLTKISNEAVNVREALQKSIEQICNFVEWPLGHVYLPADNGTDTFIPSDIWYVKDPDRYKDFVEVTQATRFTPGKGIIGEVIQNACPVWKADVRKDPNFIRARKRKNLPIRAAFAFPILVEQEIVGVLEFFSSSITSGDALLLKKMSVIGTQLGRVIERERRQRMIKHNLELFQQLFHNSPVGLIMLDESERVQKINPGFEQMFGFTLDEVKDKKVVEFLTPKSQIQDYYAIAKRAWDGKSFQFEATRLTREGHEKPVLVGAIPIQHEGRIIAVFGMYVDLSERKRAEEQLQQSLQEKEVLLAEIHHRVKNNLAVIMGLLELQKDSTGDPRAYRVLQDSQARIHSMALVHEQLYQNELFSSVQIDRYIDRLSNTIESTFSNPNKNIELLVETDPIELTMNQAVPLGLMLNEILTNAYKHAFQDQDQGDCQIVVTAREAEGVVEVSVKDNGCGLPDNFNLVEATSLGMSLINALAAQLNADLSIQGKNGTAFILRFQKDAPVRDS